VIPIVIGNYNKPDLTERCIKLVNETLDKKHPIIQIDNGCDVQRVCTEYYKNYPKALGFTKAFNEGIRFAKERFDRWDYILLLNNDVEVDGDWLDPLVKGMEQDEKVAMVVPCYYHSDYPDYWYIPRHTDILGGHCDGGNKYLYTHKKGYEKANSLSFFCVLLNRRFIDDHGLMDESFYNWCSDTDYSLRAAEAGWERLVCLDVVLKHDRSQTVDADLALMKTDQSNLLYKWTSTFFSDLLKTLPLYVDRNVKAKSMFYIMDVEKGTVMDWHSGEIVKKEAGVVKQSARRRNVQVREVEVDA